MRKKSCSYCSAGRADEINARSSTGRLHVWEIVGVPVTRCLATSNQFLAKPYSPAAGKPSKEPSNFQAGMPVASSPGKVGIDIVSPRDHVVYRQTILPVWRFQELSRCDL